MANDPNQNHRDSHATSNKIDNAQRTQGQSDQHTTPQDGQGERSPRDQASTTEGFQARLFNAAGQDSVLQLADLAPPSQDDQTLVWVDLAGAARGQLPQVLQSLQLGELAGWDSGTNPALGQQGGLFWLRVVPVTEESSHEDVRGTVLTLIASRNVVVSLHDGPLSFIEELRAREEGGSMVGALSAESFVASLLDWTLSTYFAAIADYELAVERLEVQILEERSGGCLPELRRLRRWASRLRRMLAAHRVVFSALSRPDFHPDAAPDAQRHFAALDGRFERAMDMVENSRELVLGSFALFSSQTALQTNDRMRVLTFVTVITGVLATMVGALGMNFDASFFATRDTGFWGAVGFLLVFAITAIVLARARKWF
ncbi:MAG: CorA family divalent cation transporter [Pseudomonadota bacterium]